MKCCRAVVALVPALLVMLSDISDAESSKSDAPSSPSQPSSDDHHLEPPPSPKKSRLDDGVAADDGVALLGVAADDCAAAPDIDALSDQDVVASDSDSGLESTRRPGGSPVRVDETLPVSCSTDSSSYERQHERHGLGRGGSGLRTTSLAVFSRRIPLK